MTLCWWTALKHLSDTDCISASVPRPEPTLDKIQTWIERQVLGSLVVLRSTAGRLAFNQWLQSSLNDTQRNLSPSHDRLIAHSHENNIVPLSKSRLLAMIPG